MMKRTLKILAIVVAVAILLVVAFVIVVFTQLPSVAQLKSQLTAIQKPVAAPAPPRTPTPPAPGATPPQAAQQSPTPHPDPQSTDAVGQYFVNRYLGNDDTPVRVCENLASMQGEPVTNFDQFGKALTQAANGETRDNPYVESVMAPLGYALRRPAVRDLIDQVKRAKDTGDEGFVEKAEFYSQLALATAQMWASKNEIERISQHAYHLYVITRVVNQKPDMANDTDTEALCSTIQSSISNPGQNPNDAGAEKAAMLRFLARAGLSPEQVEYDPNLPTTIGVEATTKQITLKIPWLEKVFHLNEQAPPAGPTPPPVREAMPLHPPTPTENR